LFHGALEAHPYLGIALPVATAISAINFFRLFSWLFLGRGVTQVPPMFDALPRERWAMTAIALFLVIFGIAPRALVASRAGAAESLAAVFANDTASAKESSPATKLQP
jgi:NADH:ubiquinone oxidoreductase subunit 4 (subunit M)